MEVNGGLFINTIFSISIFKFYFEWRNLMYFEFSICQFLFNVLVKYFWHASVFCLCSWNVFVFFKAFGDVDVVYCKGMPHQSNLVLAYEIAFFGYEILYFWIRNFGFWILRNVGFLSATLEWGGAGRTILRSGKKFLLWRCSLFKALRKWTTP